MMVPQENEKKRLLIMTYGHEQHASSRIRATSYIPYLKDQGWKVKWLPRVPEKKPGLQSLAYFVFKKKYNILKRWFSILFENWDAIFVQRLFLSKWILCWIKFKEIPLIYDFDDAIYLTGSKSEIRTKRMIKAANEVVVSTPWLFPICKACGKQPHLIFSPVDTRRIIPKNSYERNQDSPFTIGWIGSHWTEEYVYGIKEALVEISKQYDILVLLIGASSSFLIEGVTIRTSPWSLDEELKGLDHMDVGIMPLPSNKWTQAKGGYKLFLYMAKALPVVASPVGINQQIVTPGESGYLADTIEEWLYALRRLCESNDRRRNFGKKGREKVKLKYSYDVNFKKKSSIKFTNDK